MKLNHKEDRKFLLGLVDSLKISKNNFKKDVLGYWLLRGKRGYIDTDSKYWYVRISCETPRRWERVKEALPFMGLWQDGEAEGALRLERYPTEEEAKIIRKTVGLRVSLKLSEERKEILRKQLNL